MTNRLHLCIYAFLLLAGKAAHAQENIGGFHNISGEQPPVQAKAAPSPWGATATKKISLVNLAPVLLPFFNNAPVFGLPGTETGDFWHRTQLTGDWGGLRTELAQKGWFFDIYSTSVYQDVASGGLQNGSSFTQNIQYSVNLDTARAGLWSGGLFHVTFQSRYGDTVADTFTVGSTVPQYTGLVHPGIELNKETLPTEFFLVQALSKKFSLVLGKISDVFIPDQTPFGDSYKYNFANFNFLKNPMTTNFYNPSALASVLVWTPVKSVAVVAGVLDPNTQANNFATNAFNRVNIYGQAIFSYKISGLPGEFSPAYNWSNKPKIDLESPFVLTSPAQAPQAVAALLGLSPTQGLITNYKDDSWFLIGNVSQYLFVKDAPATVGEKLRSGQPLSGVGVFGRFGYAPKESNTVTRDASAALFARGLIDSRPWDSFGVGYYYNGISDDLKNSFTELTAGEANAKNEKGTELFYDFAITPALRLIPGYQHIWNPLSARVIKGQDHADVILVRLQMAW